MSSLAGLSPALVVVLGAIAVPLLHPRARNWYMLALPAVAFAALMATPDGDHGTLRYMGLELVTPWVRGDSGGPSRAWCTPAARSARCSPATS